MSKTQADEVEHTTGAAKQVVFVDRAVILKRWCAGSHEAQLIAETEQLVDLLYPPKLYTGLYL